MELSENYTKRYQSDETWMYPIDYMNIQPESWSFYGPLYQMQAQSHPKKRMNNFNNFLIGVVALGLVYYVYNGSNFGR